MGYKFHILSFLHIIPYGSKKHTSFLFYAAFYNHTLYFGLTSLPFIVAYTCSSFSPKPNIMEVLEITSGRTSLACFSTHRDWLKLARGSRTFLENSKAVVSKKE